MLAKLSFILITRQKTVAGSEENCTSAVALLIMQDHK